MTRPVPTPAQLAHCVAQLTRYIHSPPTPVPVVQASKWGRKVGDVLLRDESHILDKLWTVIRTDSLGLTLQGEPHGEILRVESKEDCEAYSKQRKRRTRKVAPVQLAIEGTTETP